MNLNADSRVESGSAGLAPAERVLPGDHEPGSVAVVGATKIYAGSDVKAVDNVDIFIEKGSFFSLLGPSGSGKTTILRLIAGFEYPTAGKIRIGGQDVTDLPPNHRPLHTVFQNYALFPHMDVASNIAYPLRMRGLGKPEITARVGEVLERVSLKGYDKRKPHQLSGGQRQRVALARALVGRPEVVLLDEPLGALDLRLRQEMQVVLKQLQRDFGTTFIYVTHDQGEALAMSDKIAILHHGHLHQIGSATDIYFRPATPFVATFVGQSNIMRVGTGSPEGVPPAEGAHKLLSVRPESLLVGEAAREKSRRITATVREVLFQGSFIDMRLTSDAGELIAHVPTSNEFEPGTVVDVGWSSKDEILLPDLADEPSSVNAPSPQASPVTAAGSAEASGR